MATTFTQHGEYIVHVEERLVISEVKGPWNLELVVDWCAAIEPLARAMAATGPHIGIAVVHDSLMCPPDAFACLRRAIIYSARHLGCIGNCIVHAPGIDGASLIDAMYKPVYEDLTPHLFCHDIEQAKAWSRSLLAAHGVS